MEKMQNRHIAERQRSTSYRNFNVGIYCPVHNVNSITDLEEFDRKFGHLSDHVKVGRAYIECYRGMEWADREQLLKVKGYFERKGIATSGGITTCADGAREEGFISLCYSKAEGREILRKAVKLSAEVFDELILDDFYFMNCRCRDCIAQKGDRTWTQFRLDQKRQITEEIVMKTAKEVNPDVNVIVKFPQWYEVFNETGYDLRMEPALFDAIYTGTETRNPTYAAQHLPKYLSYFVMRYLESAAPDRNLGGWFDPYECTYNLTSYLEQGYLTLFAKAREVMLFCLGSLIEDTSFRLFAPAVGEMFAEADAYLGQLGNPRGVAAYRPACARGEDNLHNYLGMCGIPFEPCIDYPEQEKVIFLAQGAADDPLIVEKMKKSMLEGAYIVVTSGFVSKLGDAFGEFVNVKYSSRKALVSEYADTRDNGVTVSGKYVGTKPILIPQLDYCTNDVWELAAAYGTDNNFPIALRCSYGAGKISVITIPDDMGDLYHYPVQVLNVIRRLLMREMPVTIDGPAKVQLFVYDNDTVIVRSDLPYTEQVTLRLADGIKGVRELVKGFSFPVSDGKLHLSMAPGVNYVLELVK